MFMKLLRCNYFDSLNAHINVIEGSVQKQVNRDYRVFAALRILSSTHEVL